MLLDRHLAIPLKRLSQLNRPLLLAGPRGAGKTHLLRREFPGHRYLSLEDASVRAAAQLPEQFLLSLRGAAILDDVHRCPALVDYFLQHRVELPVILASSRRLPLKIPTLELYEPTLAEWQRRPALPLEILGRFASAAPTRTALPPTWPAAQSFLYRDVVDLVQLRERDRFESFCQLVRERSGQLLHQQELARLAGVAHRTIVRWLAVLDSCFLTLRLPALDLTFGRRLVQRPKLHWLAADTPFESQVISQLYRNACHAGQRVDFRYWRDSNGLEIPLVLVDALGSSHIPVGIHPDGFRKSEAALARWLTLSGQKQAAMITLKPGLPKTGIHRYSLNQL
jgi:predicted AAA+ superfamily ATPase